MSAALQDCAPPTAVLGGRPFRCRTCLHERLAFTRTGPLPSVCDTCDPEAAERRQSRGESAYTRRTRELHEARDRIAELEAQLAFDQQADETATRFGPPGKHSLSLAIRLVAQAQGTAQTAKALRTLAGVARAWANTLVSENA